MEKLGQEAGAGRQPERTQSTKHVTGLRRKEASLARAPSRQGDMGSLGHPKLTKLGKEREVTCLLAEQAEDSQESESLADHAVQTDRKDSCSQAHIAVRKFGEKSPKEGVKHHSRRLLDLQTRDSRIIRGKLRIWAKV